MLESSYLSEKKVEIYHSVSKIHLFVISLAKRKVRGGWGGHFCNTTLWRVPADVLAKKNLLSRSPSFFLVEKQKEYTYPTTSKDINLDRREEGGKPFKTLEDDEKQSDDGRQPRGYQFQTSQRYGGYFPPTNHRNHPHEHERGIYSCGT